MESQDQILSFQLTNTRSRQIFEYNLDGGKVKMLYDSGAQIPVWCVGELPLKAAYPDAVKTELTGNITGFGKEAEECTIFRIPMFSLKSGDIVFRIKDLLVAEIYKPSIGCHLLLSETMFSKTDTITTRRKERVLHIAYDDSDRAFIPASGRSCARRRSAASRTRRTGWTGAKPARRRKRRWR